MANEEQLFILKQGVDVWNKWREKNGQVWIDLTGADLSEANLADANFNNARLRGANLRGTNLRKAYFIGATLGQAYLSNADLGRARLMEANLSEADFSGADLTGANFTGANLYRANLNNARLFGANLRGSNLRETNLREANLNQADLSEANLSHADLTGSHLYQAQLVGADVGQAMISRSAVYGINVWDLKGEFSQQKDLVITLENQPAITVDDIKVAQFIYLILNNEKLRDVINTITSKSVLILGRFAIPERKAILDALRNKLREYNLLPIVFDFDRPTDKDFTETIKTLAGLSYFVIADVTNPKSSPLELQATIPDYQIPFVPIIQEGEYPFAMMVDLQKKYNWVLDTISYDSLDTLIEILKPHIIDPAIKKRDELRLIKAKEPTIISGRDLLSKK